MVLFYKKLHWKYSQVPHKRQLKMKKKKVP